MAAKQGKSKAAAQQPQKGDVRMHWKIGAYALGVLMMFGAFGYAYKQITRDDVLPITEIRLVGEFQQVNADALKDLVTSELGGNFFTVDVAGLHRKVISLPWVSFAWVDRVWPQTLQVRVVEETPVAYLKNAGLINGQGQLFVSNVDQAMIDGLPQVSGAVDMREQLISKYREFSRYFSAYDLRVASLDLDDRGAWKMRLSNGVLIVLGHDDIERRLNRFLKIFGQQMAQGKVAFKRADLRYANGFALSEGASSGVVS